MDLASYPTEKDPKTGNEFFVLDGIPVFDEHTGSDGVRYDAKLLGRIVNNNNKRINDTGDAVPLVSHHTPEDKDPNKAPFIIGYADNFKLGKFGKEKPRWAIYARFKVLKEMAKEFFARPRRSVEIWPEESPEQRYFDPIALLGAETPRRDLGLIYQYKRDGQPQKYEMGGMAPTATNVSLAGHVKPEKYEESTMALDEASIAQIVAALKPVIDEAIDERMNQGVTGGDLPQDNLDTSSSDDKLMSATDDEEPAEIAPEAEEVQGDEGPLGEDEQNESKEMFAKTCEKYGKDGDVCRAINSMDEPVRKQIGRYMKHHASADEKKRYERCCVQSPIQNAKDESEALKYRKERDVLADKYAKAEARIQKLTNERLQTQLVVSELRQKVRYQKHHTDLVKMQADGYVIDMDEELSTCMEMTEDQADQHINVRIPLKYRKAPIGGTIPVEGQDKTVESPSAAKVEKAAKYAKDAGDHTLKLRSELGASAIQEKLDYATVLNFIKTNEGKLPTLADLGFKK